MAQLYPIHFRSTNCQSLTSSGTKVPFAPYPRQFGIPQRIPSCLSVKETEKGVEETIGETGVANVEVPDVASQGIQPQGRQLSSELFWGVTGATMHK